MNTSSQGDNERENVQSVKQQWLQQGDDLVGEERYEEVLRLYDKAIQIDPQGAQSYYTKGIALSNLDEMKRR